MRKPFLVALTVGAAALGASGVATATPSPNKTTIGPGQPGSVPSSASGGTTCFSSPATQNNPGGTTTSTGNSVFNSGGTASAHYAGNTGTASANNSNSPVAVSQYDIACFQVTQH